MKNTLRSVAGIFLLVAFFSIPSGVAYALTANGGSCFGSSECISGNCQGDITGSGTCQPLTSSGGSGSVNIGVVKGYTDGILSLINDIFVPVLFAIAFLTFLYGVYKYFILGGAEEKSREEGRQFVLWGIVGFVVILSVWGLVAIVGTTFNLTAGGTAPSYPKL